ncbi:MAG: hypothetical protein QOE70_977 [Chthoniobacter sp.]|jgi:hypothetical protein|nr:hypothetical protein [Chthoniobacter sp.]
MSRVLNLVLTHEEPARVAQMLDWWARVVPGTDLLLAYGGAKELFESIPGEQQRVFIADPALRTADHPLERQSYTAVFQQARTWMQDRDYTHVYFAEYDHLPLAGDLHERLLATMQQEQADVLVHHLQRIDGTNDPHYLYECSRPEFHPFWERLSCRRDGRVVLTMIATGSFWTREAFSAVAERDEPFRVYLEIYLPTLAHHLGFRIRDLASQNKFVTVAGDRSGELAAAAAAGAWSLHQVKTIEPWHLEAVLGRQERVVAPS